MQGAALRSGQKIAQPAENGCNGQAVGGTGDIIMLGRGNILAQRQGEQLEILEHHREDIHVLIVAVLTDVDAVEQDDTLGGVV